LTTSSETSTERVVVKDRAAFQPWQFYILLSMLGATAAVIVSRNTHPVALLLISAAVVCAGLVGVAFHRAMAGLFGQVPAPPPPGDRARAHLEREKALVLRSIKELEFDHKMRKVSVADYNDILGRLRTRALTLMQELERMPSEPADVAASPIVVSDGACPQCGTSNDADAKFCKQCGQKLEPR
jgi:zinc-ribbon domain